MIVIIDYGMGNLGSIQNMLKKVGATAKISADPNEIEEAGKIILPGVGAFDTGMKQLNELKLIELLNDLVLVKKIPTLGVCLGMQLLTERSEEGSMSGLGWIDGETRRFLFDSSQSHLKIPHMGWNTVNIRDQNSLFQGLDNDARFYFVHSYYVECNNSENILATTNYGFEFVSAVKHENVMGVQFHPEKSHRFGMQIYRNFTELS